MTFNFKHLFSISGLVLAVGSNQLAQANAPAVSNRVLVKFKESAQIESFAKGSSYARYLGALSQQVNIYGNSFALRYATSLTPLEAAKELRKDPRVEWAQPDYLMKIFVMKKPKAEHNPLFSLLQTTLTTTTPDPDYVAAPTLPSTDVLDPNLSQAWGLAKVGAIDAWKVQKGSRKVVVADIDTGIDYTHPDLVNNLWHNPSPDATMKDEIGYDFANKDAKPFDDNNHGTHTAGTIGATGGNGIGTSGVSQAVSIMALKFITSEGQGTSSDAVLAIDYGIAHGARVMSNSWGGAADDGEDNQILVDAVARAEKANILFVAAAGNDGTNNDTTPMYPAAIKSANVLAVASTNAEDHQSFFSNYGPTTVHVGAPGSNVYSTLPGNQYGTESGTSMACPHVAGLAALILAQRPDLTAVQVKEVIMKSVDLLPALQGKIVTGGRINAVSALQAAMRL